MKRWIEVDQTRLNEPIDEKHDDGVTLQVFISPYDIPSQVRGDYDEAVKRFAIEFRYLAGDEETTEKTVDKHVKLFVGKHSNRLYRIEVDVDNLNADSVQLNLIKSLDELRKHPRPMLRRGNFETARKVIAGQREVFAELAGT